MGLEHGFFQGAGFLVSDPAPEEGEGTPIQTPEQARAEVAPIAEVARRFADQEVVPAMRAHPEHDPAVLRGLLRRAGELGLLGVEVEEAYGGSGLGSVFAAAVTEEIARTGDFAVTFGAHSGIGTLPLAIFGTPEQKARYLPSLVSGERVAAYALTEPMAGSDALSGKSRATPVDGGFVLEGQKQWITNAGFADLMVVYAKVNGEQFTAFLVETASPGLSLGPEEDKLGIRGSSTRAVYLDGVRVPAENVLGEIGRGHVIAFGVLNVGRFKLAAGSLGSGKAALEVATAYAEQRRQFGRPIAEFGLVGEKLAEMAARLYTLESMVYRTAGLMEARRAALGDPRRAVAEVAVECSINKVYGSETLDFVVDEALQIHGGYGFMNEYPVSRMYRDARINRIFEGTNEINRLLIPDAMMRRALKGGVPLFAAMAEARQSVDQGAEAAERGAGVDGVWLPSPAWMRALRQAVLYVASVVVEMHGTALESEQEKLERLADLAIALYAAQGVWMRARLAAAGVSSGRAGPELHRVAASLVIEQAARQVEAAAQDLLSREQLGRLRALLDRPQVSPIALRRALAQAVRAAGGYPFEG
ncbi:acyl-CoA dehydrogenase family protein [Carboxydochorda subterranea]|uniref:Acyl-CoA dehydrogenase family protein n=1 Tax=Carboxydichorda subterranea TaxID=3109565 RepID=A0ABZ1C0M0_9FIRM|nr:acyl-CoA dehydrogenase family protein [Limnochorda sp. L945t]WRP18627.1 acyl-CoA dehydrogenase family protein [Limnochorda sp. L945t]